jgi:hypothetical protein
MLAQYRTKINVGVSLGVFLILGCSGLAKSPLRIVSAFATLMTGWSLLLYGCAYYARAKGHSEWLGLLGLLFLPGMLILILLRDKNKSGRAWWVTRVGFETAAALPTAGCVTPLCVRPLLHPDHKLDPSRIPAGQEDSRPTGRS